MPEQTAPDFRCPNVIRLVPVAFYVSFEDMCQVVDLITEIMENQEYRQFDDDRVTVA